MKYLILVLLLTSCKDPMDTTFKCQDGILYVQSDGAWIQAIMYKDNKCLPLDK